MATDFSDLNIHTEHGCLFSQLLFPLFNHRTNGYDGWIEEQYCVTPEVIEAIPSLVGPALPIGIRIHSADKLECRIAEDNALKVVRILDQSSIWLILTWRLSTLTNHSISLYTKALVD